MTGPVVVAGASGFVGRNLVAALAGRAVRCGSRDPGGAAARFPDRAWVHLDLDDPATLEPAFAGADALIYLVHSLGAEHSADLVAHERATAERVRSAAERAGLRRIVYLGGPRPEGTPSPHLQARLQTGEILRTGPTSTIELRASMIVGAGSESWKMCRDLALRLPLMALPPWASTRTQPIGIDDVVAALTAAIDDPLPGSAAFDLPGPEILTAREVLERTAAHAGFRPVMVPIAFLTPRISSLWLRFVTGADYALARQLVDGMSADLIGDEPGYWARMGDFRRTPFDQAVARALAGDPPPVGVSGAVERVARRIGRRAGVPERVDPRPRQP
jgi:uncharacterized protein YbjT (DUF2867 family)